MAMGSAPMWGLPSDRALVLIANGFVLLFDNYHRPPPSLEEPDNWSKEFNEFLSFCLQKNVEDRPLVDVVQQVVDM